MISFWVKATTLYLPAALALFLSLDLRISFVTLDWLPLRNVMWWLQGAFTSECNRPTDCVSIRSSAYRCMVGGKIALLPTHIKSIKSPMRRKDAVMSLHQIRSSPEQKATIQSKVFLTVMQCFSVRSRLLVPSFPVNCLPLPSLIFFHPGAFSTSGRLPLSVLILMRRLTSLSIVFIIFDYKFFFR